MGEGNDDVWQEYAWENLEDQYGHYMDDPEDLLSDRLISDWSRYKDRVSPPLTLLEYIEVRRFALEQGRELTKVAIARRLVQVFEDIRDEIRGLY